MVRLCDNEYCVAMAATKQCSFQLATHLSPAGRNRKLPHVADRCAIRDMRTGRSLFERQSVGEVAFVKAGANRGCVARVCRIARWPFFALPTGWSSPPTDNRNGAHLGVQGPRRRRFLSKNVAQPGNGCCPTARIRPDERVLCISLVDAGRGRPQ
jgi:hypothetical protein